MKKTTLLFVFLLFAQISFATIYYVTTTGNNANDGLTEATAWRTFSYAASQDSPVTAGDTVYIKAGDYGSDDVFIDKNYDANDARIAFIGYQNVPGDITSFDFSYGDNVDPTRMPLINPGDRNAGEGINLSDIYSITIKNIQIANCLGGFNIWNTTSTNSNHVLENIFIQNIGWEYATAIIFREANNNTIKNCLIVNATGAGMDLWGDNNHIENCKIYSNESQLVLPDSSYTSMDYYIALKGNNNLINNCYAERDGDIEDNGHGFEIKESGQDNLFVDCTVKNMVGGCFGLRWANVQHNEFRNCHALGGVSDDVTAFQIREGASYNAFNSCTSEGCEAGIRFILNGEDADYCGHDNRFNNCLIVNAKWPIDLNPYDYNSAPVDDNIIVNCVIDNADYLFNCERPNTGNKLINCIITNVDSFSTGDNTVNFAYQYSDFYNNGFAMPSGTGNISGDPLFVNASSGDYHLQETSPCIDAGTATNAPAVDFEGTSRPQGDGYDIGLFEYTTPMEVELLSVFTARQKDDYVILRWTTGAETQNRGFQVQRSTDGILWQKIGWIHGNNHSGETNNYAFLDKKPFSGINYYRFKQIDLDGKYHYSNIDSVHFHGSDITLQPNPVTDRLIIKGLRQNNGQLSYRIFDVQGRFVTSGRVTGSVINTRGLASGLYLFKLYDAKGQRIFSGRFVRE